MITTVVDFQQLSRKEVKELFGVSSSRPFDSAEVIYDVLDKRRTKIEEWLQRNKAGKGTTKYQQNEGWLKNLEEVVPLLQEAFLEEYKQRNHERNIHTAFWSLVELTDEEVEDILERRKNYLNEVGEDWEKEVAEDEAFEKRMEEFEKRMEALK